MSDQTAGTPVAQYDYSGPQLVGLLGQRAKRPPIALKIDGTEILQVPTGACVTLTAATGEGKSSLALQLAWTHALDVGPAVYLSLEMDADEIGARLVGQRCGASWLDALQGRVPAVDVTAALDLPRFHVLEWDAATIAHLAMRIRSLREQYPGQPVLGVFDYVQIVPGTDGRLDGEARTRVSAAIEEIRRATKSLDIVTLAISQCSREVADQLRNGNKRGDQTTSAGAESAQIERAAHATMALGDKRAMGDDDEHRLTLSIGKNRMGPGNREVPLAFNGRTGRFRIGGPPVPAGRASVEQRASERGDQVVECVRMHGPLKNPTAVYKLVGGQKRAVFAAIKTELKPGGRLRRAAGQIEVVPGSGSLGVARRDDRSEARGGEGCEPQSPDR